jgi:hypothetical protein
MSWSGNAKRRITGGGLDISVDRPSGLPTTTAFGLGRHQVAVPVDVLLDRRERGLCGREPAYAANE